MHAVIQIAEAMVMTPDGGIADPTHPVYALLWLARALTGGD